jgi:hypothetical protein
MEEEKWLQQKPVRGCDASTKSMHYNYTISWRTSSSSYQQFSLAFLTEGLEGIVPFAGSK